MAADQKAPKKRVAQGWRDGVRPVSAVKCEMQAGWCNYPQCSCQMEPIDPNEAPKLGEWYRTDGN